MITALDYRPKLTAALTLAAIVLLLVVMTATLLITSRQAPAPTIVSGGNPAVNHPVIERHAEVVAAYNAAN